jgi:hypothetical protein
MKRVLKSLVFILSCAGVVAAQNVCSRFRAQPGRCHSPLDLGFPDRHDDPQNFDLEAWAKQVQFLINMLETMVID